MFVIRESYEVGVEYKEHPNFLNTQGSSEMYTNTNSHSHLSSSQVSNVYDKTTQIMSLMLQLDLVHKHRLQHAMCILLRETHI